VEFFIHDAQWRVVATYRQEPAPAFVPDEVTPTPRGPTNPNPSLPTARPAPLLYERYVYYARGIGGRSDIKGPDQPILRQRFKYYRTVQVPVLDENGEPTAVTQTHNVEIECFAPGTTETAQGAVPTAYTRIKQETVYYIQRLRGDVVSLISSESAGGEGSASGDGSPPSPGNPSVAGARVLETVRCTSFGVPRVYRRYACDIADDEGSPLIRGVTASPLVPNGGVTESDYNLFFAIFFEGCAL